MRTREAAAVPGLFHCHPGVRASTEVVERLSTSGAGAASHSLPRSCSGGRPEDEPSSEFAEVGARRLASRDDIANRWKGGIGTPTAGVVLLRACWKDHVFDPAALLRAGAPPAPARWLVLSGRAQRAQTLAPLCSGDLPRHRPQLDASLSPTFPPYHSWGGPTSYSFGARSPRRTGLEVLDVRGYRLRWIGGRLGDAVERAAAPFRDWKLRPTSRAMLAWAGAAITQERGIGAAGSLTSPETHRRRRRSGIARKYGSVEGCVAMLRAAWRANGARLALDEVGARDHAVQVGVGAPSQGRSRGWRIGEDGVVRGQHVPLEEGEVCAHVRAVTAVLHERLLQEREQRPALKQAKCQRPVGRGRQPLVEAADLSKAERRISRFELVETTLARHRSRSSTVAPGSGTDHLERPALGRRPHASRRRPPRPR